MAPGESFAARSCSRPPFLSSDACYHKGRAKVVVIPIIIILIVIILPTIIIIIIIIMSLLSESSCELPWVWPSWLRDVKVLASFPSSGRPF